MFGFNMKIYQYSAGLQEQTGEIIYSRSRHDFRKTKDLAGFVDGGMDYFRASGLKHIIIELTVDPATISLTPTAFSTNLVR